MRNDYFDSSEFKRLLAEYQDTLKHSVSRYFDVDDFVDLTDYYVDFVSMDEALVVLAEGLRQHPDSDRLKLMLAGIHVCMFNYKLAENIMRTLDNPTLNNDYYYVSAQLQLAHYANYIKADKLFRQWIGREEEDLRNDRSIKDASEIRRDNYLHILTSVREFVHDEDLRRQMLIQWIEEYIRVFSAEGPLGESEIDLSVAEVCRIENLPVLCEKLYTLMLDTDPYLEGGWAVLAAAQYSCGKYPEAVDSAEYALAVNPDDTFSLFTKAHAFYAQANFEAALATFQKYKQSGADSPDLFIASCLVRLERYDEAKPYLITAEAWNEGAVAADQPDYYANNCYEMAECHLLLGTYDKALQLADKALTVSPQNFDFMQTKGAALLALGKHTEAFQVFTDSVALHDDLSQALLLTGLRYLNAGEPEAASKFFLRVLAEENPAPQAYAYLTYTYFQMSDTVKFLASLRKSVEVCPEILRDIMGHNFPGIEPQNYYDHIVSILSRTQSAASEEESGE